MADYVLTHHGIKGMKWGIRRSAAVLASLRSKSGDGGSDTKVSPKVPRDAINQQPARKSVKKMSEAELKEKISRMELEKKYKDLKKDTTSKGQEFIIKVIENIGEKTLTNLGTQVANHFGGELINAIFKVDSKDEENRIVNPQKGQKDK